jgi:hypothetical protein
MPRQGLVSIESFRDAHLDQLVTLALRARAVFWPSPGG